MGEKEKEVQCPTCRYDLRIRDLVRYKQFRCPRCGMIYEIRPIPAEPQFERQEEAVNNIVDLIGMFIDCWERRKSMPFHVWPEDVLADLKIIKRDIAAIIDRRIEELEGCNAETIIGLQEIKGRSQELKDLRRQLVGEKGEK